MNKKKILWLLLPLLLPAGCTKEDNRNCQAGLYICFETKNPKHSYPDLVAKLDLFFYGRDGNLKADFHYTRDELRQNDRAAFVPKISEGDYRIVAVVNGNNQDYETLGIETYEALYTRLREGTVDSKLTDLLSSEKQVTVGRIGAVAQTETMTLAKHNNNIRLKIHYENYIAPYNTVLDAFVEESGGIFHYNTYSSPGVHHVRYLPWDKLSGSNGLPQQFDISTFRLWIGSDATIHIREIDAISGNVTGRFYTLNITNALITVRNQAGEYLYDTNEKLEYYDEYEITITLGGDFVVLSVSIDNWNVVGGGVEI